MHFFKWYLDNTNLITIFMCLAIVAAIEVMVLTPKQFPWKKVGYNYSFIVTAMTAEIAVRWAIVMVVGHAVTIFGGPLIDLTIAKHGGTFTQIYAVAVALLAFDFFFYWHHRFSHKYAVLWETHKLHHAEERLNGSSAFVNHWTDDLLRSFTVYAPMAVLFKFEPITVWWFSALITFHVIFTHVDIRVPLGPLTPLINGPQLHRLHHTNEIDKIDKNFAFYFPIWDIVFGTYLRPKKCEHTTTGLVSGETINGLFAAHIHPFVAWYRMAKRFIMRRDAQGTGKSA